MTHIAKIHSNELEMAVATTSRTLQMCRDTLRERREIDTQLAEATKKALRDYEEDPLYDNHQSYMSAKAALRRSQTDIDAALEAFEHAVKAHLMASSALEQSNPQPITQTLPEAPETVVEPTITWAAGWTLNPQFVMVPVPVAMANILGIKQHGMLALEIEEDRLVVRPKSIHDE